MDRAEELKKTLRWMDEYHLDERAERLQEIGGLGVGGLEPRYSPHFIRRAETEKETMLLALQDSIFKLWNEAAMCYVDGQFRACIVLLAMLLEAALKYELQRQDVKFSKLLTLGQCIKKCKECGILSEDEDSPVIAALLKANENRNDVVHANIERDRPNSLLDATGPEHEVRRVRNASRYIKNGAITGDGDTISFGREGLNIIYRYKTVAKGTLECAETVLRFLYPLAPGQ
jgi:hypothetical protein